METIKLTFLGTGDAIPTKRRNHQAILASFADENMLFDCGEGTQRQFKAAGLTPTKLTRIFITHWHGDHVFGIPGLVQTLAISNYQKTLKIYGPKGTKYFMDLIQRLVFAFHIKIEVHEISAGTVIDERDFKVEAANMKHGPACLAYSLILKDKIKLDKKKLKKLKLPNTPLLRQLKKGKDVMIDGKKIKAKAVTFKEKGKKLTVVLDTSINQNAINLAKDSDIVITESSFAEKESAKAREYNHLTAREAGTIAKKSKSKMLILTHISQRYEKNPAVVLKEAKKVFKNTKLVKDLDSLKL